MTKLNKELFKLPIRLIRVHLIVFFIFLVFFSEEENSSDELVHWLQFRCYYFPVPRSKAQFLACKSTAHKRLFRCTLLKASINTMLKNKPFS